MKAYLKNYRQSPRKVRLLADFVRGKKVSDALNELRFLDKRAAPQIGKVIKSAAASAKHNFDTNEEDLIVKEIRVDKGFTLKRWLPRAFGRATPLHKHASNITVVLEKMSEAKEITDEKKETQSVKQKPKTLNTKS